MEIWVNKHPVWEKVSVSYWEFALKDTPGDRKKGVSAETRKVSTEIKRAVVTWLLLNME